MTLHNYFKEVKKLRALGKDWNLSDQEIDKIIDDSFQFLEAELHVSKQDQLHSKKNGILRIILLASCAMVILCGCLANFRRPASTYIEKNIHQLVYPAMKLLRKVMLPLVRAFPSITGWYDEVCLISNPYFHVPDLDCWPCEEVKNVLNLTVTDFTNERYHSGIPFITKDPGLKNVSFNDLRDMYRNNKHMFDRDAPRAVSHLQGTIRAEELISHISSITEKHVHITWRLNRMEPTRALRTMFGMPKKLPSYITGATPEKFLMIDEFTAVTHQLPVTEGATVYLIQGSGSRLYILEPSPECQSFCHRVSVVLEPYHILWYNWWYWRATSAPVKYKEELSITFMGSYF